MPIVFDPERKWFFVHIPKAAGSSFWRNSCKDLPRIETNHEDGSDHWGLHHETATFWLRHPQLQDYTPVSILRNPWDRALSFYNFHTHVLCVNHMNDPYYQKMHARLIREGFKGAWMPGGIYEDANPVMPQSNYIHEKSVYFRVEDQVNDLLSFTERSQLPRDNASARGRDYRPYYDDELRERIATLFAKDIELGGYTF
jgi:hypothetical protein